MKIWSKFIKSYGSDKRFNLGPSYSKILIDDPKLLSFVLSRYKFVSKILEGKKKVLEVGCGESFGSPLVKKAVKELYCCDYWEPVLNENKTRFKDFSKIKFLKHDFNLKPLKKNFDAAYLLDVFEHIAPLKSVNFIKNISKSLKKKSILIIGVPNKTAEKYASKASKLNHINLMTQKDMKKKIGKFFDHMLFFGMNDETLHTGYDPMQHYFFAVCIK